MRNLLATRIAGQEDVERDLLEYALGGLTAEPITNAFFAACRELYEFDRDERKLEANVRKAVLEEIKQRNDVVHGDWLFDELGGGGPRSVLHRVKAGSIKDAVQLNEYTAADLDKIADEVEGLYGVLYVFAKIALRPHGESSVGMPSLPSRLSEAIETVDGKPRLREGIPVPSWG